MMSVRDPVVVAGPTVEPVSIEEAKAHLRLDHNYEDVWLMTAIAAAREDAETFTGRALAEQTLELRLDRWPAVDELWLPRPPVTAVSWVKYTNELGAQSTLAAETYLVDAGPQAARLRLRVGQAWPGVVLQAGGLVVRYTAGYPVVPARVKQAILMMVGHLYENREATLVGTIVATMPFSVERLLYPLRVF